MIQLLDNNENNHNDVQFCNTKNLDYELQNSYIIISKINEVPRKIKWISYIIEKDILEELEYKNLISHFTSQKTRKIDFKWNIL